MAVDELQKALEKQASADIGKALRTLSRVTVAARMACLESLGLLTWIDAGTKKYDQTAACDPREPATFIVKIRGDENAVQVPFGQELIALLPIVLKKRKAHMAKVMLADAADLAEE